MSDHVTFCVFIATYFLFCNFPTDDSLWINTVTPLILKSSIFYKKLCFPVTFTIHFLVNYFDSYCFDFDLPSLQKHFLFFAFTFGLL